MAGPALFQGVYGVGGGQDEQGVAAGEALIAAADAELAVGAADAEQLRAVYAAERFGRAEALRRRAAADLESQQHIGRAGQLEHVFGGLHDAGVERGGGELASDDLGGGEDAGGAGLAQGRGGLGLVAPRDYVALRIEAQRGKRDEGVLRVAARGHDQRARLRQAGFQEGFAAARVALHGEPTGQAMLLDFLLIGVDDRERAAAADQFADHPAPDAACASDDYVVFQRRQLARHPPTPQVTIQVSLEQRGRGGGHQIQPCGDAYDGQADGEGPAGLVERMHLAEAYRGQGEHDLVERVEPAESADYPVADQPSDCNQQQQADGPGQAAEAGGGGGARQQHQGAAQGGSQQGSDSQQPGRRPRRPRHAASDARQRLAAVGDEIH